MHVLINCIPVVFDNKKERKKEPRTVREILKFLCHNNKKRKGEVTQINK